MSLPFAVAGAVTLALVELSVAPHLRVTGLTPDLVLVAVVAIASVLGLERAIGWAFVGGLMIDLLSAGPYRPIGSTAFTLLAIAGLAALTSRVFPSGRLAVGVVLVFVLAILYHLVVLFFLSFGGQSSADPTGAILPLALLDAALAVPVVLLCLSAARRLEPLEGPRW